MTGLILKYGHTVYKILNGVANNAELFIPTWIGRQRYRLMWTGDTGHAVGNSVSETFSNSHTEEIFYKLREAIAKITSLEKKQITADTTFEYLFPPENRKRQLLQLQKETGYTVRFLKPNHYLFNSSAILFFFSVAGLFVSGMYGMTGIVLSMLLFYLSNFSGTDFVYKTLGQAAEKIALDLIIYSKT